MAQANCLKLVIIILGNFMILYMVSFWKISLNRYFLNAEAIRVNMELLCLQVTALVFQGIMH